MTRSLTRRVMVGSLAIGGGAAVSVQSMTNTDTRDAQATIEQIRRLEDARCDLVRVAVRDQEAADALQRIVEAASIPVVADIHFDYRLALSAIRAGVDKLRINPGNIGSRQKTLEVVAAARDAGTPIRIGVNGGSLPKDVLEKYGGPTAEALVESALSHVGILESMDFLDIVISIKSSDVMTSVDAYSLMAARTSYPLHVGITEAGGKWRGTVKSCIGIGAVLSRGIGDTIRVSLTDDPVEEVRVGRMILNAMGLRSDMVNVISCPTCGRTRVDLGRIAAEVESRLAGIIAPISVAVMGCEVNGPGEAREADYGVACGKGCGLLFRKGQPLRTVSEERIVDELVEEVLRDVIEEG
ncbi:MAG: flavodoxin-dependent (E)-4-hydroxy-3-methylbut-2-enyl-diphosphate synthase [Firmicutes bacterium]|nr:flavodoxin-dependent (E)-4-hydroxy-3-methylbut-2-enyl-diphosphate synthase [Bacillota bacterium]